jgi:hypothetical protein
MEFPALLLSLSSIPYLSVSTNMIPLCTGFFEPKLTKLGSITATTFLFISRSSKPCNSSSTRHWLSTNRYGYSVFSHLKTLLLKSAASWKHLQDKYNLIRRCRMSGEMPKPQKQFKSMVWTSKRPPTSLLLSETFENPRLVSPYGSTPFVSTRRTRVNAVPRSRSCAASMRMPLKFSYGSATATSTNMVLQHSRDWEIVL